MSFKTLSTKSSKQIVNLLKKSGIEFLDYSEELTIHKVSSLCKTGRNPIVEEIKSKGRTLADKIDAFTFQKNLIHIELTWYNPRLNTRHAMALLYYPQEYKLEFFDPTGYKHIDYSKVGNSPKELLIEAFSEDFTPDFLKRKKWGWVSPISYWLQIIGDELIKEAINSRLTKKYFPEIQSKNFKQIKLTEKWKILIFWRWCIVNEYT